MFLFYKLMFHQLWSIAQYEQELATSLPGGTARYFQSITKIISFAKTQASTKIKKYFIILPEQ